MKEKPGDAGKAGGGGSLQVGDLGCAMAEYRQTMVARRMNRHWPSAVGKKTLNNKKN